MENLQDFKSWQENLQSALVTTTKTINRIASEDLSFQRTVSPSVAETLDDFTARLLQVSTDLLKSAAQSTDLKAPTLEDADDVDIKWRGVVDVVDSLLERADTSLDEYTGLVKRKEAPTPESGAMAKKPKQVDRLDKSLSRANILKPQNAFERKPDNFDEGPWKPLLTKKPHAIVPLDESLGTFVDGDQNTQYDYSSYLPLLAPSQSQVEAEELSSRQQAVLKKKRQRMSRTRSMRHTNGTFRYKHPYETEILTMKYPEAAYQQNDPILYSPVESTSAIWVDTFEGVLAMLEELKQASEIAVDLEHHDYRTYTGLLSLMQISTRDKDWVVDTLKPWRHRLEILNEVFADPNKVKVFHGAYMDIIWLQRDLGLYVVGLFDTFHACESLDYPKRSLAYLLKRFANFDADKKYQMADWRIRPLPDEMLYYARSDTHYLLYVYDMLRNSLIQHSDSSAPENNKIEWVLQRSKETALMRYEAQTCEPETGRGNRGWFNALTRTPIMLSGEQFAVYKAVYNWRDHMARQTDESPVFIMPGHALSNIAKHMPTDSKALTSLFGGLSYVVKSNLGDLLRVIREAKARGVDGPTATEFLRRETMRNASEVVARNTDTKHPPTEAHTMNRDVPQAKELRSGQSQLWGSIPVSSLWEASSAEDSRSRLEHITIPIGFVASSTATEPADENKPLKVEAGGSAGGAGGQPPIPREDAADREFTLRVGRNAKNSIIDLAAEEPEADSSSDDEVGVSEPLQQQEESDESQKEATRLAKEKQKRRKEKKRAKRQQNQEAGQSDGDGEMIALDDDGEDMPFDYSKAKSVLHAKREGGNGPGSKSTFDPYTSKTTAEGPKGARRMHGEKAGKSASFKK